ncbi:MAG TPA: LysR family transcriptional regulator [Alphaproteobacteria bacterium]|nr:LysR family transcriptional regulator [Alphaproteobacteria bacterium]
MAKLTLRIDFGDEQAIGPGKVRLLELIRELGSISAAGRAMGMSYRRAWLLADSLNRCFREPVVFTKLGGRSGGGAALTGLGEDLVESYRTMEAAAAAAASAQLRILQRKLITSLARSRTRAKRAPRSVRSR